MGIAPSYNFGANSSNIEEILSVPGIDGLFIGPYDLSGSMGIVGQFDHPERVSAREKVINCAKQNGVALGIHVIQPNPEEIKKRIKEGFQFIACSIDTILLSNSCSNLLKL